MQIIMKGGPMGATPSLTYGVHCGLNVLNRKLTKKEGGIQMRRDLKTTLPKDKSGHETFIQRN